MAERKLRLDVDALHVQSFRPEGGIQGRGTAFGYSGVYGPQCASICPSGCSTENPDSGVYGPTCPAE